MPSYFVAYRLVDSDGRERGWGTWIAGAEYAIRDDDGLWELRAHLLSRLDDPELEVQILNFTALPEAGTVVDRASAHLAGQYAFLAGVDQTVAVQDLIRVGFQAAAETFNQGTTTDPSSLQWVLNDCRIGDLPGVDVPDADDAEQVRTAVERNGRIDARLAAREPRLEVALVALPRGYIVTVAEAGRPWRAAGWDPRLPEARAIAYREAAALTERHWSAGTGRPLWTGASGPVHPLMRWAEHFPAGAAVPGITPRGD